MIYDLRFTFRRVTRHAARGTLALLLLSALRVPHSALGTPVMFPLDQMFGGAPYVETFTIQAAQTFLTDGTNAWVGRNYSVTPTGGTNPVVLLTPNTYLVTFPDATYPWRISVPNTTNQLSALNLSTGPLPTFLVTMTPFVAGGAGIDVAQIGSTNVVSIDPSVSAAMVTNGADATLNSLVVTGGVTAASFTGPLAGNATTATALAPGTASNALALASTAVQPGTEPVLNLANSSNVQDLALPVDATTNGLMLDPLAAQFAKTHSLSVDAQRDLNYFFSDLRAGGVISNLVDGVLLASRFQPSAGTTLMGTNFTGVISNTADGNGALIAPPIYIQFPTAPVTNLTLILLTEDNDGGWRLSAFNTNTFSAVLMTDNAQFHDIWERNGATMPWGGNFGPPYTNMVQSPWINGYSYQIENGTHLHQRQFFALARGADGVSRFYENGVPAKISYYNAKAYLQSTNPTPDSLNWVGIGTDATNYYAANLNTNAIISAAFLFNSTNASVIQAAYRATLDLQPENHMDFFVGDSLVADTGNSNNFPWFYELARGNRAFKNLAQGGTKAYDFYVTWNANGGVAAITNFNREKFSGGVTLYYGFGVNDAYGSGNTAAQIFNNLTNGIAPYRVPGLTLTFLEIEQLSSSGSPQNSYTYSLQTETNTWALDEECRTNGVFNLIVPRRSFATQFLLNTNNGFSPDGLHFNSTNTYANREISDWMLTGTFLNPTNAFYFTTP